MAETTDLQRLVVSMEARYASMERELRKANAAANKQARAIETRFAKMNTSVGASLGRLGGVVAGAFSIRAAQQLIDASTRIQNSLKVAGLSGEELTRVYDRLFESAQRNAAPLEALVDLYGRASLVQKELGVSTEELLRFTDRVAVALRVSGKSAAESSGALLQLSQALGSGIVRAEEFNSLLEGALPIAQAAAAGLREAGGSVAKLRQLVVDGKVSSEAFFRAFEAGAPILQEKLADAELTVSQGFVRLQNVLIDAAGRINETTGASHLLASALNAVSTAIEEFGKFVPKAVDKVHEARLAIHNWLVELTGIGEHFDSLEGMEDAFLGTTAEVRNAAAATEVLRQKFAALKQEAAAATAPIGKVLPRTPELDARFGTAFGAVKPVTLADYDVPATAGKGESAAEKAADKIADVKEQLAFEAAQLARTAREREVYNQLKAAGVELNTADGRAIAEATGKLYDQQQALAGNIAAMDELRNATQDLASGLADAFLDGKDAGEAFGDMIQDIGRRIINSGIENIIAQLLGTAGTRGTGVGGTIASLLFGGARANGGPVSPGRSYLVGERGPELIVPRVPSTVIKSSDLVAGSRQAASKSLSIGQVVIQTPDPASFRRSEAQVSAMLGRAVQRSARFT
jgi:tape measure domain-containing protein